MITGERQVAPDLSGIRRDHRARYQWAILQIGRRQTVADFACGIGYGAHILARAGHQVFAYDISQEALDYAAQHYAHPRVHYRQADGNNPPRLAATAKVGICFETIEHIEDPRRLLNALGRHCTTLLVSVPNEDAFPWAHHAYHFRHYTQSQFAALLAETGWVVTEWHGQATDESDVEKDVVMGRTLIAKAVRSKKKTKPATPLKLKKPTAPNHVSILGLGPSVTTYLEITKRLGGRHKFCDETWAINALGNVFACDRIFHMDDVRIQEIRAKAAPESNIAALLPWLKTSKVPVITSRAHPDYPALVEFPLQEVLNSTCGFAYFNSTAAYAIVYAIWLGVKQITVFGNDFTYANSHHSEKGRACVEFWLGFAQARGIKIVCPQTSSLLDACNGQDERLYGYDTLQMKLQQTERQGVIVHATPRAVLPTAEEIEHRYDHERHPNALVDPNPPKGP